MGTTYRTWTQFIVRFIVFAFRLVGSSQPRCSVISCITLWYCFWLLLPRNLRFIIRWREAKRYSRYGYPSFCYFISCEFFFRNETLENWCPGFILPWSLELVRFELTEGKNQLMNFSSNWTPKSDVCLHLSKICLYIQNEAKSEFRKQLCEIGKTIGFASFIISWVLFRFVYFPKKTWFNTLVRRWVEIFEGVF